MSLYIVDIHGELEGDYEIIKKYEEPTTKNNCAEQNGCITCSLDDGDDCCRKLYEESMQEPTTKNDLGVDCVSRQAISGYIDYILSHGMGKKKSFGFIKKFVDKLPSVTPQEPSLDKLRAEIETKYGQCKLCEFDSDYDGVYTDIGDIADILQIIDKYKAESEDT